MPQQSGTIEIFCSYSHRDEGLRQELEKHLKILEWRGLATVWHDRQIGAGNEWENEIDEHLEVADIILLLISPDFIFSKYCYAKEMTRAIERHDAGEARVIPIFVRDVNWKGAHFGKLQGLPTDAKSVTSWPNQDEAFRIVSEGIEKIVEALLDERHRGAAAQSVKPPKSSGRKNAANVQPKYEREPKEKADDSEPSGVSWVGRDSNLLRWYFEQCAKYDDLFNSQNDWDDREISEHLISGGLASKNEDGHLYLTKAGVLLCCRRNQIYFTRCIPCTRQVYAKIRR